MMSTKEGILNSLKWLWGISRGWRRPIALTGIVSCLHIGASLSFVWVSKRLIDIATGNSSSSLGLFIALLISTMALQLAFSVIVVRLEARTEIRLRSALRYKMFTHLMESRWTGKESFHSGDVLNRLESDITEISNTLCVSVPTVISTLVQIVGATAFLSGMDYRLALVVICIMPVAIVVSKSYLRRMRRLTAEIKSTDSRVQSHLQENLQHRTLLSALEYTSKAADELDSLQTGLQEKVMERTDYSLFSRAMVQIGFAAGYATVFIWGVVGIGRGTLSFGAMAAFLQLVSQIQRPFVDLGRQIPAFVRSTTSAERLSELESLPLENSGEAVKMSGRTGVRFENVSFAYPDGDKDIFNDFSYDFRPGSITAVVGETGAGKSTLIRLMLALLVPDRGHITLYDENAPESDVEVTPAARCNFVYIPQGNTLVSGTVRENLLLGKPEADDRELARVLHTAVADFVFDLPKGLDTVCGEFGAGLSEGQAQRIAIARGLLRPGGVLLLDEATSALDPETEHILMRRLSAEIQGRTVILITHREAITSICTGIVRIDRIQN